MASFEDLTPYRYLEGRWTEAPDALNVGWLDTAGTFVCAPVPNGFTERLQALVLKPVNLCRGWHNCWCGQATGNGEIRVTGADGTVYAAPVLIAHYVAAHGYRPPQAFIDAVSRVHALVLLAFVGPRPPATEGTHLDGVKSNNRLENLAWRTKYDNEADKIRHGTKVTGTSQKAAKLNDDAVRAIRGAKGSVSVSVLAKRYGVSVSVIYGVQRGVTWKHVV